MFSILVLSTKKRYSGFFKKVFVSQKICFKVTALKMFKFSKLSHKNIPISQMEGLFWKSLVPFCRRTYALSINFKWNLWGKRFFYVKTKTNSNFALKVAEGINHSFLLPIWWISFLKHLYCLICNMEFIELNWLCKNRKKFRNN